ncbi:hypothetical protein KDX16_15790 [Burkholderia vietnamiensis]|jgi:hypothetical protein|uniref:Uncharacterized protein n=1 Tax=Burkholderia aenigmatica TaxID=2015348 RepID=A0A6P2LRF6_9BURK|nr:MULTISPECIES: hypothetical protein [Burkholderia]HDR9761547.1 hypothetical protein [Burkholderia cepacia ATCC 25416]MBR7917286.1 hypothetical protein [Burkholderia vietnamiensis]MBR8055191.1 hypothetical protein [Burkholderia vietnamiensis]VWB73064.1 hypothetical protein BLA13014_03327 [Burkholderia aenigmatica]HDR9791958.1 hypothetical protein [Burkholderia cepacia ATCC 25416]
MNELNHVRMVPTETTAPVHAPVAVITDHAGNALEVGAMYCCTFLDLDSQGDEFEIHGNLVRYIGAADRGRLIFADADDWIEIDCEFDRLVRQACPVIDPAAHGWGENLH